ncbi:ovarian-specific serine/threonine-protein kinase Lok-like [Schistocerca cancellata]|uniref:ovarian-specific serine/threonine-protein kinase Lok-like n=1 Tax=Schistocerca cancellata TaxID=274614 RepID=UPI00211858CD|nr:ovarian-specific serine/threonine-protein kinase Lok-like [Schistocerca cancellata]
MNNKAMDVPNSLPDTQQSDGINYSQDIVDNNSWGRLYATRKQFTTIELTKDEYTVGRLPNCDVTITEREVKKEVLTTISKLHFKIRKTKVGDAQAVYLEDCSFNGTFVNGEKIGKGRVIVLQSNDQISLAAAPFRVYLFMSASSYDSLDYPEAVRSRYVISRKLGAGACGEVFLVFEKKTCNRFAMKVVEKKRLTKGGRHLLLDPEKVMNEVKILTSLKHPCIITIHDIVDTSNKVYMFLELMEGGELFDRITKKEQLGEPEAKLIFYQIVVAVQYLHSKGITHRDLKPENILLSSDKEETLIKVSDFGLSRFVTSEMTTVCGTPLYAAPEVLVKNGRGGYTMQVDVWSLGVILYACLSGYLPFSPDNKKVPLKEQIRKGNYSFPIQYWRGVSPEAIDLIKKMLTVDPIQRITVDGIVNHLWLQDELMRKKADNLMREGLHGIWPDENSDPVTCGPHLAKRPRLD